MRMNQIMSAVALAASLVLVGCGTSGAPKGEAKVYERVKDWRGSLDLRDLERQYDLPKGLLSAVIHQESAGRANAVSRAGAQGLFQIMPATARDLNLSDSTHPENSAKAAAQYLSMLYKKYNHNLKLTLAAYNWGMGNVNRYLKNGYSKSHFKHMPAETQNYVARVTKLRAYYN